MLVLNSEFWENGNINNVIEMLEDLEKQNMMLDDSPSLPDDIKEKNWEEVLFVKSERISKARLGMHSF